MKNSVDPDQLASSEPTLISKEHYSSSKTKVLFFKGKMKMLSFLGLYRDEAGFYKWSNGRTAAVQQGFWASGEPQTFQSGKNSYLQFVIKKTCLKYLIFCQ